jgi:multidrug efflux system membrane fusion protein
MRLSYLIAIAIAAGVAAWVLSGQFGELAGHAVAEAPAGESGPASVGLAAPTPASPNMTVRVQEQTAVEREHVIKVRGVTEASRAVVTRAEVGGAVEEILVTKGTRVSAGQVLARLDLADRPARLAEIQALVRQRLTEYDITKSLAGTGHTPMIQLVAAETALQSAQSALERIELEIEKTEIKAPFAGIIEARQIQIGDIVSPGSPIATIVDEDPFLVVGQVSENDIGSVRVGSSASARLLDGRELDGTVRFLGIVADAQTRTFRIELEVRNGDRTLRAGLTADMSIPAGRTLAHFVSPAALVLGESGTVGVKTVNADGVVEFHAARVIAADNDGAWLDGLPLSVAIITVGHQFVRTGDVVQAEIDTAATR